MAPSAPKCTALLLLVSLLLLLAVVSHAAREVPAAMSTSQPELQDHHGEVDEEEAISFTAEDDERCGGGGAGGGEGEGEEDEECLMRRTLEAQTDYIYTRGSHN
ncbi:hypothetical protein ACP70R_008274 [Stipagrostis hirtigluma subsp. patula]